VLHSINGQAISNAESALEAYRQLRHASLLTVAVTRSGRPVVLDYEVQPAAADEVNDFFVAM
jgi:hypothetical protein